VARGKLQRLTFRARQVWKLKTLPVPLIIKVEVKRRHCGCPLP
jgi:hypothetical protein